MTILLYLMLYVFNVMAQNACIWGRSRKYNDFINGEYTYSGNINNAPWFTKSYQSYGGIEYETLYIWRSSESQYYITNEPPQSNDKPTTYYAICDIVTNSPWECGLNKWRVYDGKKWSYDPDVYSQEGSCPEWDCDAVDTTSINMSNCNIIWDNKIGSNAWTNTDNNWWFYFHPLSFQWVCMNKYIPNSFDGYPKICSDPGWVNIDKGNSVYLYFYDPFYTQYDTQYEIKCIAIPTMAPTMGPTELLTSVPTSIPSQMPSMRTTKLPTINPSKIPTVNPIQNASDNVGIAESINITITTTMTTTTTFGPTKPDSKDPIKYTINPQNTSFVDVSLTTTKTNTRDPKMMDEYDGSVKIAVDTLIWIVLTMGFICCMLIICVCCYAKKIAKQNAKYVVDANRKCIDHSIKPDQINMEPSPNKAQMIHNSPLSEFIEYDTAASPITDNKETIIGNIHIMDDEFVIKAHDDDDDDDHYTLDDDTQLTQSDDLTDEGETDDESDESELIIEGDDINIQGDIYQDLSTEY